MCAIKLFMVFRLKRVTFFAQHRLCPLYKGDFVKYEFTGIHGVVSERGLIEGKACVGFVFPLSTSDVSR